MVSTDKDRLLIVDDEVTICSLCKRVLGQLGYSIDTVNDGRSAKQNLLETAYGLILLDLRLPVENGMILYNWMKDTSPQLTHRVIFMTGTFLSDDISSFLEETAQPMLAKPFRPDELIDAVQSFEKSNRVKTIAG